MLFSKVSFYKIIFSALIFVFALHLGTIYYIIDLLFQNKIIESYLINIFTATLLYYIIDKHKAKFKDNIGFIFMLSSFLKFGLFFIFINPSYKADGLTTRIEFTTFFIPYAVCLIIETFFLIQLLNKLDYTESI